MTGTGDRRIRPSLVTHITSAFGGRYVVGRVRCSAGFGCLWALAIAYATLVAEVVVAVGLVEQLPEYSLTERRHGAVPGRRGQRLLEDDERQEQHRDHAEEPDDQRGEHPGDRATDRQMG